MKKWKLLGKRAAAFLLGAVMAVNPGLAGTAAESLLGIVSYAEERTASVNATNLNVRVVRHFVSGTSEAVQGRTSYSTW